MVEKQKGRKVKFLRSDNEGEYIFMKFKDYLASEDIEHELSTAGRPEQNRVAERMNWTLTECARNMRLQPDMSEGF